MTLKIKSGIKRRRRGNRLIVTAGGVTSTYVKNGKGNFVLFEKVTRDITTQLVKRSPCGRYAWIRVVLPDGEPGVEHSCSRDDETPQATRLADAPCPWFFTAGDDDRCYVSASQTTLLNKALVVSISTQDNLSLPIDFANFLAVSPVLCATDAVVAIQADPRFAKIRNFDFRIDELPDGIPAGKRAASTVRHQHTNYDKMLEAGGGLLWPEVYEKVRKGVDVLVAGAINKTKP